MTYTLAAAQMPKEKMAKLAEVVSHSRLKPIGFDLCKYGICIDMLVDGTLADFDIRDIEHVTVGKLKGIDIFPWGIRRTEMLRVRVGQEL